MKKELPDINSLLIQDETDNFMKEIPDQCQCVCHKDPNIPTCSHCVSCKNENT